MVIKHGERSAATAAPLAGALRDAIMRLNRRLRQARPVGDLTMSQISALTTLGLAGVLSPRELAEQERVQPPTMTKIVAKLEDRGLVQRTPHPTDGRQVVLAATEAGRAAVVEHRRAGDAWLAQALGDLPEEDRETLRRAADLLDRVARAPGPASSGLRSAATREDDAPRGPGAAPADAGALGRAPGQQRN